VTAQRVFHTVTGSYDRERVRRLNEAIDEALRAPRSYDAAELRELAGKPPAIELAERVRRRAARRGAHVAHLAERRDALIAAIYALATPRGWFSAWCDGSVSRMPGGCAGVGVVVMDPKGQVVARVAQPLAGADPFAAEIAALAAALNAGLAAGAACLCAYTDCRALAQLWGAKRLDPRLETVRAGAHRLRRFRIHAIPRGHNQAAHALARAAVQLGAGPGASRQA
jgi:ribonuclease HI